MHKALHTRDDVERLYVSRKGEGKGIAGIEDTTTRRLHKSRRGKLITATRKNAENTSINQKN